jgi:HK97 family phage major capsid protein
MPVSRFEGIIPPAFSQQIITEATQASAVMQLANRVPMGVSVMKMPVPKTFPKAGWVAVGGRKPFTDLSLDTEEMTAEEVAAVIAIPDVYVEDFSINIWNYARPLLAEAVAAAIDDAILYGVDAPATFPTGGVAANAVAVTGSDALDVVNKAMSAVENSGLNVTGAAADIAVKGALRGLRDSNGDPICGCNWTNATEINSLYGQRIAYVPLGQDNPDFFVGNWRYCFVGVRSDIRYLVDPNAVIADADGRVIVTGFQDNTTPMKVWMRVACAIVRPVTRRCPTGATPFAKAQLAPGTVRCAPAPSGAEAAATRPARAGSR